MRLNLTRQITIILAVFILVGAAAAIIPAYLIVRQELVAQLIQRRDDAIQHSKTILQIEQNQLESLILLATQRPTLERLMQTQDVGELQTYLHDFQQNTSLDAFYVTDTSGVFLAGTRPADDQEALSFTAPVSNIGVVVGAILLDTEFTERLEQQTGFRYQFYSTAVDPAGFQQDTNGTVYNIATLSLQSLNGYPNGTLVVMLPVEGLLAAEGQAVGLLAVTTVAVALLVSLGGGLYIRNRIRPLWKLTAAAHRMGQGDLATEIGTTSTTSEIHTLANVLEQSRVRLQLTLKELSQAKEWSEALIQSVVEGIITLNIDREVTFFSEGAARITGMRADQLIGQNINTLFQVEGDEVFTDFIPPEGGRRTLAVRASSGQALTLALSRARRSDTGQITIVLHDITEETQRRNLQTYFLANVSHEFRTPLAGMKVSIELLLENARHLSTSELNELLNSLYLSVSSLQNLIDNLLESSKIEANHFSLRRQPLVFNQVLNDALRVIQPFMNRRRQTLRLDEPLTLPVLNADQTRLTQVLVNLLSNASKYSPMSSPINILIDVRGGALYVAIADHGQGIPEEQRESIFRQFVRLNREAKSDYSTGLGLAVVKTIIEVHGGQVGVEAREGGGSVFWFTLPLEEGKSHESVSR